jgi:hypothetical protein
VDAVADFTGSAADDVFNAPAASATTGAAVTTVNSGDTIDGGAGNDTLNITATAANNNSLAGLTATSIETVNIVGANNLGASSPALAAAEASKVTTAAALAAAIATSNLANSQSAAANAVEVMADTLGGITISSGTTETTLSGSTGAIETAVAQAATATVASAATRAAAARYFDEQTLVAQQEFLAAKAVGAFTTETQINAVADAANAAAISYTGTDFTFTQYKAAAVAARSDAAGVTLVTGADDSTAMAGRADALLAIKDAAVLLAFKNVADVTTELSVTTNFALADYKAVAAASLLASDGTVITTGDAAVARNAALDSAWNAVNALAASTGTTDLVANQVAAAAAAISTYAAANSATAADVLSSSAGLGTAFTALNTTAFTEAQFKTAAANALKDYQGVAIALTSDAAAVTRASELATSTAAVAAVNDDFSIAQLNAAAAAARVDANGATIITAADDSAAIEARTDALATAAATAAGTAATAVTTATAADTAAANAVTLATAGVTATSVAASTFADATAITLSGSSSKTNVTAVAATQTIGFSSVSSMDNSVTFGSTVAAGSLAVGASTGALTVTGATMTALNVSGAGTGTAGIALTDGGNVVSATGADTIKALNLTTSGSTVINTTGMTALTSVTQTGAGAVTVNSTIADGTNADKLATVTTGAGADNVRITTATSADNLGTTIDETVNASVSTGAGNDRILVATSSAGTGKTTVDAGEGNDTVVLSSIGTGVNSLSGGAGNDTFRIGGLSTIANTTISGGDGTDTLRTTQTDAFTATHYTTLVANVSSIETLQLAGAASVSLDASRVAVNRIEFLGSGTNTVTEVSSLQALAAVRTPASALSLGIPAIAETATVVVANITASAKGYVKTDGVVPTVFGDNLNISMTHVAADATVVANGTALTLSVAALGAVSSTATTTAGANVTGIDSQVTLSGDVKSVTTTLTSARGVGSVDAPAALGAENVAKFAIKLDADGETSAGTQTRTLGNLETVTVVGAGVVTIDTRTDLASTAAKLTTINLSGMTALADLNELGQEIGVIGSNQNAAGAYRNKSTSTVTLDNDVVETVVLGGAKDTVETTSAYAKADTITGFQLVASAADPLVADASRSDVLKVGGTTALTASNAAKMTVTGSTLEAALLQAASLKNAAGNDVDNVVFNFGGNTYFFQDLDTSASTSVQGLDDGDILVKMSGTLNLDLLLTSITIA